MVLEYGKAVSAPAFAFIKGTIGLLNQKGGFGREIRRPHGHSDTHRHSSQRGVGMFDTQAAHRLQYLLPYPARACFIGSRQQHCEFFAAHTCDQIGDPASTSLQCPSQAL